MWAVVAIGVVDARWKGRSVLVVGVPVGRRVHGVHQDGGRVGVNMGQSGVVRADAGSNRQTGEKGNGESQHPASCVSTSSERTEL